MSKRLVKDKSLYSIKKLHSSTVNGDIYENDYVTIIKNDGIFDETPLYSESNFKYKIRISDGGKKRHVKNDWLLTDSGEEEWTKDDLTNIEVNKEENIVLRPNYKSLKDFAYYGSAVELLRATVNDIMLRYPGGLYYYDNPKSVEITVGNQKYYLISNECRIDCWSDKVTSISENENPLRYLSFSYDKYVNKSGSGITEPKIVLTGSCINTIIGTVKIADEEFKIYKDSDGNNQLLTSSSSKTGVIIEPNKIIQDKFWSTLTDFERVLLNRDSNPLYTAVFETPFQDETGYYYVPKSYTWPLVTSGSTAPDLTTNKFVGYLNSLISLAEFHDEYDSDNMWRMMTHESIKNLDWTFATNGEDASDIDNSRLKAMIHLQGYQYDEIKRYIDGIKNNVSLSYNKQNNTPDYFLSDIAENNGWDAKNVLTNVSAVTDEDIKMSGYSGTTSVLETSGKAQNYINNEFLRRLGLSSNYIQSMKGTKKGVEAILGMFGFDLENDVDVIEYYATVTGPISYSSGACLRAEFDYVNADEITNYMEGYPVAQFINESDEIVLYPWYDKNEKYVGNFYYQCKGGWGKMNKLDIKLPMMTSASAISGNYLYTETEPYMLFVENLNELVSLPNTKIKNGIVCYVADLTGINDYKSGSTEIDNKSISNGGEPNFSNYFILRNVSLSSELGFVDNDRYNCYGWYNIKKSEFNNASNMTEDGTKVLYLETIKANYKGNNPHTGKGEYDFGLDYLLRYKQLFKEAIDTGKCKNVDAGTYSNITNFGFDFSGIISAYSKCEEFVTTEDKETESLKNINLKNVTIRFKRAGDSGTGLEYKKYIINNVLPYLELMIPSSLIVEYLFGNETSYMDTIKNEIIGNSTSSVSIEPGDIIMSEASMWMENDTWNNN